jgi:predicted outer membrane repeat protein
MMSQVAGGALSYSVSSSQTLMVVASSFTGNRASATSGGTSLWVEGGAIHVVGQTATVRIRRCNFTSNVLVTTTTVSRSGAWVEGNGGAVYSYQATVLIMASNFVGNVNNATKTFSANPSAHFARGGAVACKEGVSLPDLAHWLSTLAARPIHRLSCGAVSLSAQDGLCRFSVRSASRAVLTRALTDSVPQTCPMLKSCT